MNTLSLVLIFLGLALMLIGSLGITRLPDIYSRLQASGVSDIVGVVIVLLGFLVRSGFTASDGFLGLLAVFFFVTGPIVTHSIAKAAFLSRVKPSGARDGAEDE